MNKSLSRFLIAAEAALIIALAPGQAVCFAEAELPTIHIHVFLSDECPHCEPIQKPAIAKLSKKLGCRIVPTYHDVDDMAEYKLLVRMERQYKKPGNDLPVVIAGETLLGGTNEIERRFESVLRDLVAKGGCTDTELPTHIKVSRPVNRPSLAGEIHIAYFDEPGCRACQRVEWMTALLLASGLMQETACDNIKEQRFETDRFDQRPEFAWEGRSIPCSVEGSGKMLKVVVRVWKGDPSVPPDDDADSVMLERLITP